MSYFQVLADADLMSHNPIRKVRKCAEPITDQPKLSRSQVGPLFDELGTHQKFTAFLPFRRNYLFFLLAYYTGARPVELLNLSLESFSQDGSVVQVL